MKRASNEDFNAYRERRKQSKIVEKAIRIGTVIFSGGTYRKHSKPESGPRPVLISPAIGKRHEGEPLDDFRKRRRICNSKRRDREKTYRNSVNIQNMVEL